MNLKPTVGSFLCTLVTSAILLYLLRFAITTYGLDFPAVFWTSIIMAIIGLAMGVISFVNGIVISINEFFIQGIFIAFGLAPFCFIPEYRGYIAGGIWMSVLAAIHLVICAMGFITQWQNTYESFTTPK